MSISEPFIRRSIGTSLLAIGLFLTGLTAYRLLPVASVPRVDYPMVGGGGVVARGGPVDGGLVAGRAAGTAAGANRRGQ